MWLAVDKVIHHHNVFFPIIRAGCRVACCDSDSCDERVGVVEHDAEKGKARVAWRGRHETAEQQPIVGAEIASYGSYEVISNRESFVFRLVHFSLPRTNVRT